MVLILDNKRQENFPKSTRDLFKYFPVYQDRAKQFLTKEYVEIGPKGLLYVGQSEFAVSTPADKNVTIIGSDDATTCIIAVLRHSQSGATALTHFDGTDMKEVISEMVKQILNLSSEKLGGSIELQLIGGYTDEYYYSDHIFSAAMRILQSHPSEINLKLACVGEFNTILRNGVAWPIFYGAGVDLKTGEVFPAKFSEKGPEVELRHTRLYSSRNFAEIYDSKKGFFKISPFSYKYSDDLDILLSSDDSFLLQHSSTSPLVEPPHFVQQTRRTLKFMKDNPDPLLTVFKNRQPHLFKRSEDCNSWIPLASL